MQAKHVVCGLVVVALVGGFSSRAMAEFFPWWAFDSVIEEVQDRGTLRVGLGLFEPWSACNTDGELIGFEIDVATKVAEDMGVEIEFARTNWNYIIPSLIAEEFDVIISGLAVLPSLPGPPSQPCVMRRKRVVLQHQSVDTFPLFSRPYTSVP